MRGEERVRRFVDGELSPEEEQRLRRDAAVDPALGAKLERALRAQEMMRRLAEVDEPSSNLAERSFAAAMRAKQAPEAGHGWRRLFSPRWVRLRVSLGLVALPIVAAALLWVAGRYTNDSASAW